MNQKAQSLSYVDLSNEEYISTESFMEYMASSNQLPYNSVFSFTPFVQKLEEMTHDSCPMTKAAAEPVKKFASSLLDKNADEIAQMSNESLQISLSALFPYMFLNNQKSFIGAPFQKKFYFKTPGTRQLFETGEWLIKVNLAAHKENMITSTIRAGAFLLKKFYNIDVEDFQGQLFTVKNKNTGLEKHFEVRIKNDFVDAKAIKPLKKLSKKHISKLLNNIYDESIWLKAFPPENFEFNGFLIGTFYDVTGVESMSILKNKVTLPDDDEMKPEIFFPFMQQQLKNFLELADLQIGMVMVVFEDFFTGDAFSLSGSHSSKFLKGEGYGKSVYEKAFTGNIPILIDDLNSTDQSIPVNKQLLENGIQSLIIFPIIGRDGTLNSIFEIGSSKAMQFNALTLLKLKEFFELMNLFSQRFMLDMENMISNFIQHQFTSIHQSVRWKFEEVATKFEVQKNLPGFKGIIDPIVFSDIYPLYGQADIVSSSTLRNASIRADLTENLQLVLDLMNLWDDTVQFHLMESYVLKVEKILSRIDKEFISSDETLIVDLLNSEIHPLLEQLALRYPSLPSEPYEQYLSQLDGNLGIVYKQRKAYEDSVNQLNSAISNFLEQDDERMQGILPHYFEKYKTDGIEYNIYIGDAILKEGGFSPFFLKDFRIWQLVNACEITQLVENLAPKLPVPLRTAQLLFVYNNALSIRFRMDEKQFDVDGSYNVRYEILKKRIDKAIIKGTGERLTVAGKVAIVYLQDKDRAEYLEYFEYLYEKGYITDDIEELELEKLQGAEGLKALRITVNPTTKS